MSEKKYKGGLFGFGREVEEVLERMTPRELFLIIMHLAEEFPEIGEHLEEHVVEATCPSCELEELKRPMPPFHPKREEIKKGFEHAMELCEQGLTGLVSEVLHEEVVLPLARRAQYLSSLRIEREREFGFYRG